MNYIQNTLNNNKNLLGFIVILIIVAAIPITVFVSQQQQEIRQRAQEYLEGISLYFTGSGSQEHLTDISFTPNNESSIELYLDMQAVNISGFDIIIEFPQDITNIKLQEGKDANKFNFLLWDKIDNLRNSVRFAKFNFTSLESKIKDKLHLLTLIFTPGNSAGTIKVAKAQITSPSETFYLTVSKPTLSYQISKSLPTATSALCPAPIDVECTTDDSFLKGDWGTTIDAVEDYYNYQLCPTEILFDSSDAKKKCINYFFFSKKSTGPSYIGELGKGPFNFRVRIHKGYFFKV